MFQIWETETSNRIHRFLIRHCIVTAASRIKCDFLYRLFFAFERAIIFIFRSFINNLTLIVATLNLTSLSAIGI